MAFNKRKIPSSKEGSEGSLKAVKDAETTSVFAKINNVWKKTGINVIGTPPNGSFTVFQNKNNLKFNDSLVYRLGIFQFNKPVKIISSDNLDTVPALHIQSNFTTNISQDIDGDSTLTELLYVGSSGNVGVGTTDVSSYKFDIVDDEGWEASSLRIKTTNENNRGVALFLQNNQRRFGIYARDNGFDIRDITDSDSSRLKITSNGNVGIGTTSPSAKLHLDINTEDNQPALLIEKVSDQGETALIVNHASSSALRGIADFQNNSGSVMKILADGNVGIGNTSPSQKLDVTGNVNITGIITNAEWNGDVIAHAYIGNDAIDGDNIADNAVDTEHIADDAIEEEHIGDGEVKTAAIADDAVTENKLANTLLAEIDANTAKVTNATHSGDVTGSGALTIAADAVTYAKMQNMTDARMLGNNAGSDGVITEMTKANVLSFINVADGATVDQTNVSGTAATVTGGTQTAITTCANLTTVGALASGTIASGFGTINNGSDTITTTGTITGGTITSLAAQDTNAIVQLKADESDDAGDDWQIVNHASNHNLSFQNDIASAGTGVALVSFTPHATATSSSASFAGTLSAGGQISATSFDHFMDTQIHNYNSTLTALHYIPFGGSQTDSTSTADTINDQTLYIAPYDGYVVKLILQSATGLAADAGSTKFHIRVNGVLSTRVTETIADETSLTVAFGGSDSSFNFEAGDRIRIAVDPVAAMKDVTATSVWRYTI